MAVTQIRKRKFKPAKTLRVSWDSFRKQLNTLLRDSELSEEQAKEMTNLIVEGKGIVTQRPGTSNYYLASENGKIRGLFGAKVGDTSELLAISDDGWLTKKSSSTYERINGASWVSGEKVRMVQLQNKVYIVQKNRPLVRYDGTTLLSYTTVTSPTSLTATNLSGVSGGFTWSWRVAAETDAGTTLASDPIVLANLPEFLEESPVKITWSEPSAASGIVTGYSIYGRDQGAETRMARVPSGTTSWIDDGTYLPSQVAFLPDFNETGGPNAKFAIKSAGKIILANIGSNKSRVMWSGADVNVGKFHWTKGGGYTDIDKDDGTEITAIKEVSENKIVIWKERAIYQMTLAYNSDLGIVEPSVQKITDSIGCLSADTVITVENDTYFVGRRPGGGVSLNSLGYQPNILANVLRTAELSAGIRPNLEVISTTRLEDMFAVFYDQRYWWFYPISVSTMRAISYDYERGGFSGPHTFPANPIVGTVYYDSNNVEHFVYGDGDDGYITEVSNSYTNDKNSPFNWIFTSKKENFGLGFQMKTLLKAMAHLSNIVGGTVDVQILTEDRTGNTKTEESFSVSSPSTLAGWGSFKFGTRVYGGTDQASTSTTNTTDVRRIIEINKSGVITAQVKVTGTGTRAKIVELGLVARPEAEGAIPSDWRVV